MQAGEGLPDQRADQEQAEEEREAVLAEKAHRQRFATPT
jgi:hypothetical protein